MKKLLLGWALFLISIVAFADCYSIRETDSKNYCLAKTHNQSSYCYNIHDSNIKNDCLALLHHQRSYCYNIRNDDMKNMCLSLVKK